MSIRLKSLELQGYKTFASRTPFAFAGNITAIVGPNGSGKSNIVDALRWVLGEQSFGLLRGKKTEDMIFSGSEHRPRAGMATATILFDNTDNWLPIDYSEVALTRRATRDGQNDYLINGQKVRLRDVIELLAQAGLSERTYTIIGQGLVDAALSLKADERRRLFEEAAGIGLHRSRREETLRRLDTTKRNLERVEDILAELGPRLRSLEKQARRAEEYDQAVVELRELLREWYGYHWHLTQRELVTAQDGASRQEQTLEQTRNAQAAASQQLSALRNQIQARRGQVNSWNRELSQLYQQRDQLGRQLAVSEERERSLDNQRTELERQLAQQQAEVERFQQRADLAGQTVNEMSGEVQSAQMQLREASTALKQRIDERQNIDRKIQDLRRQQGDLNNKRSQNQTRISERQNRLQELGVSLGEADKAIALQETAVQQAAQELRTAEQALANTQGQTRTAEQVLQEQRQSVLTLEQQVRQGQKEINDLQADLARLTAQKRVFEQAEQELTGYGEGTKALIKSARQRNWRDVPVAVAGQLDVPAEVEKAIAAALGDALEGVAWQGGWESVEESVQILGGKDGGRGILLPLEMLSPDEPANISGDDGIVGVASKLINAPASLRPAIDVLLGQVVIVRSLKDVRNALPLVARHGRVVTLQGEVFHPSGMISAGSSTSAGDQRGSRLARSRQVRELGEQIESLTAKQEARHGALSRVEDNLRQVRQRIQELESALQSARKIENEAARAKESAALAHQQAKSQVQWRKQQAEQLHKTHSDTQNQIQQLVSQQQAIERDAETLREEIRTQSQKLSGLPIDELSNQQTYWQTQLAVVQRAESDARQRAKEAQDELQRNQASLSTARNRLDQVTQSYANLRQEKQSITAQDTSIAGKIDALVAMVTPVEQALSELESSEQRMVDDEERTRQALSSAEHFYAQARIALNRQQEILASLKRRIEDDFGLVAFEYVQEVTGPTPLPLDGYVERLPVVQQIGPDLEDAMSRKRAYVRRLGPVNPEARREYQEVQERHEFLVTQVADLEKAEADLRQVIHELDELMQREFIRTFDAVAEEFKVIFTRLFGGGTAKLILTNPDDIHQTGIDIEARLPGRRVQGLSLLSGGERSLTATALVFALLRTSPTPFCVLDEVDAMLDEANVGRFRDLLREMSDQMQFLVITHNRNTVQAADVIYGVTMGRDSTSQVISLRLDEATKLADQIG